MQSPKTVYPLIDKNLISLRDNEDTFLSNIEDVFKNYNLTTAGLILEPIEFNTGNILRIDFLNKIKKLCEKYHIPLIFNFLNIYYHHFKKSSFFELSPDFILLNYENHFEGIFLKSNIQSFNYDVNQINLTYAKSLNTFKSNKDFFKKIDILSSDFKKISNIRYIGSYLFFDANSNSDFEFFSKQEIFIPCKFPTLCYIILNETQNFFKIIH